MKRLYDYPKIVDVDLEDAEDPEQLLNEWLGELDNLTGVSVIRISFCYLTCTYFNPLIVQNAKRWMFYLFLRV